MLSEAVNVLHPRAPWARDGAELVQLKGFRVWEFGGFRK